MLGYCTVGSAGITPMFEHPSGGRVYGKDGNHCFVVLDAFDRKPATVGNGSMFGLRFDAREDSGRLSRKGSGARRRRRGRSRRMRPEVLHVVLSRPRRQQALRLLHGLTGHEQIGLRARWLRNGNWPRSANGRKGAPFTSAESSLMGDLERC